MAQFEVTFKDLTGKNRFEDEYGFGTNPPAVLQSKSKKSLRKELATRLRKDKVMIVSIKKG